MERHEILEAMSGLKLYGMRASFDEIAGKGLTRRDEIYPLIVSLIRAEQTHRQARSISYRIGGARFPVLKDLDKFVFADTPVDAAPSASLPLSSAPAPGGASSIWLISSTNSSRRRRPAAAGAWPRSCCATTSSSSTNSATSRSVSPADSCCST